MTTMTTTTTRSRGTRRRAGLVLAGLLSIGNALSALGGPTPEGEVGPPPVVIWGGTLLGVIGLVAVVVAWRTGSRAALRVAAGTLIVTALTAVPAFFVDVPALLKAAAALSVLLTIAAVVLMFSSDRSPASVDD